MGRKAIRRERKALSPKAISWLRELIPLMEGKDLDKLTLDELAALLGKSKSTLYTYFSTKEEIFAAAVQLVLTDLAFVASPEALATEDMEAALRELLRSLSKGLDGVPISFLQQLKLHYPQIWLSIEQFTTAVLANFECIYRLGMERGDFKGYNLALLCALDQYFVLSIMPNAEIFKDEGLSLEALVKEYLDLRMAALRVD